MLPVTCLVEYTVREYATLSGQNLLVSDRAHFLEVVLLRKYRHEGLGEP